MEKLCKYCNKYYPQSEFGVALTTERKVYHRHKCKNCYRETKRKLEKKRREWLADFKKSQKCQRCNTGDYRVLEFHHTKDKSFGIASGYYNHLSMEKVQNEINKCIVLCANCHRIIHLETGGHR